jgi:hypothetical protein
MGLCVHELQGGAANIPVLYTSNRGAYRPTEFHYLTGEVKNIAALSLASKAAIKPQLFKGYFMRITLYFATN